MDGPASCRCWGSWSARSCSVTGYPARPRKQTTLLRSGAYVDFLRSVSQLAHSSTSVDRMAARIAAADAKAGVAIYGAKEVVAALARFEETGAALDNPESLARFVQFAAAAALSGARPEDL